MLMLRWISPKLVDVFWGAEGWAPKEHARFRVARTNGVRTVHQLSKGDTPSTVVTELSRKLNEKH